MKVQKKQDRTAITFNWLPDRCARNGNTIPKQLAAFARLVSRF